MKAILLLPILLLFTGCKPEPEIDIAKIKTELDSIYVLDQKHWIP